MYRPKLVRWAHACVLVLAATSTGPSPSLGAASEAISVVEIRFLVTQTIEDAVAIMSTYEADAFALQHQYSAAGRPWTGGMAFDRTNAADAPRLYRQAHADMTGHLLAALSTEAGKPLAIADAKRASVLQGRSALDGAVIFGATAAVRGEQVTRLAGDHRLKVVDVRRQTGRESSPQASKPLGGLLSPARSHAPYDRWVPDDVWITVQPATSTERYILNEFVWQSGRSLGFGFDDGYEADFYLSANGGTYVTSDMKIGQIPDVYWITDLPRHPHGDPPYLDTRYGDYTSQELAYTVGTPGGINIGTAWIYSTYVRGRNGTASSDWGRHYPQLNQYVPPGARDTWRMFGHPPGCYSSWSIAIPAYYWHWNRFSGPYPCY